MFVLFAACTCPTFEEMDVVDGDGTISDTTIEAVEDTLAEFAAWTQIDGVCVPEIVLYSDLLEPLDLIGEYEVGGQYRGDFAAIMVDADSGEGASHNARHELCHALDLQAGYSTSEADLLPDVADRDLFDEKHAPREDFALACDAGPSDTSLDTKIAEYCWTEPHFREVDRFLAETVYPGAPQLVTAADPIPLTVTSLTWSPAGEDYRQDDITALGDGVAVLVASPRSRVNGETQPLVIREFAADLTTVTRETTVSDDATWLDGEFIPADDGLYVLVDAYYAATFDLNASVARVEVATGNVETLPVPDLSYAWPLVISSGVVYAAFAEDRGGFQAWAFDGTPVPVSLPVAVGGVAFSPDVLWPVPGGFGFLASGVHGRFDGQNWETTHGPAAPQARFELGDGRTLVTANWLGRQVFVESDGVFALAGDPCNSWITSTWSIGGSALVDGLLFHADGSSYADPDTDGDGVVSETGWFTTLE